MLLHDPGFNITRNLPNNYENTFLINPETKNLYPNHFIDQKQKTYIIFNDECNHLLRSETPIYAETSRTSLWHSPVTEYIRKYYDLLIVFMQAKRYSNKELSFFDESKLCLLSDLTANNKLIVRKGYYYHSFLTNDIYSYNLKDNDGQLDVYPPFNLKTYPIYPLGARHNAMNNHIGISTIAITTDNKMLLTHHNSRAAVHRDTYQPSGSGSADYADLKYCYTEYGIDFRKYIILSAERELFEETHFKEKKFDEYKKKYIKKTVITGFFRDIIRGGKPDFCCATQLNIDYNKAKDLFSRDQIENNDKFDCIPIGDNYDFSNTDMLLSSVKDPIAPSLIMCYRYLKEYLSTKPLWTESPEVLIETE